MKITSFLARLSGTVTFADGTTSMLHSQYVMIPSNGVLIKANHWKLLGR